MNDRELYASEPPAIHSLVSAPRCRIVNVPKLLGLVFNRHPRMHRLHAQDLVIALLIVEH